MSQPSVEERLSALKSAVAQLKAQRGEAPRDWRAIVGTFADDPIYDRAMRYGREYRESLRPGARKRGKQADDRA